MSPRRPWSRNELLIAFKLYCELPFGRLHSGNPVIIEWADRLGRTPSALAMKLTNIASLDPEITRSGRRGLSGASRADRDMWAEMEADWEGFFLEIEQVVKDFECKEKVPGKQDTEQYLGQDKIAQAKVRVGQSLFRKAVLSAYQNRCCITGLAIPELLVASHIVPWRVDPKNRLNPRNGLCLNALHDKAFDAGIITIDKDFKVVVSKRIRQKMDKFFANALLTYDGSTIYLSEKFRPCKEFLEFHRKNVFEKTIQSRYF